MLRMPDHIDRRFPSYDDTTVTLIGIDPGTTLLGVAVLTLDVYSLDILTSQAFSFNGNKLHSHSNWIAETHGDRIGRIKAHEENLYNLFMTYRPIEVSCESPFYSQKHPSAFAALTEVICAIRNALMRYDGFKELHVIDPPNVKKAVGAPGNAQKDVVREKVINLPDLCYSSSMPLHLLDEHAIDSIAVAYARVKSLKEKLCLI